MKILSSYDRNYLKSVLSSVKLLPSLHIGGSWYNFLFPRKANINMYLTNRCNSRCVICNHWEQPTKYDLSLKAIDDVISSRSVNRSGILLQGGEPLLHPEFEKILELLKYKGVDNLVLLTNGTLTEKLIESVEKYKIKNVTISLDGAPQTYRQIRGIDAYDKVLKSIDSLKDKTMLSVCFTAAPWTSYDDYLHVEKISQERKIRFMFNVYSRMEYSGRSNEEAIIDRRFENDENPYVSYYNAWVYKRVNIPCLSMRFLAVIRPDGNVTLCQLRNDVVLGNLYEKSFDTIWNSRRTKEIQRENRLCNDCWVASHRPFDIKFSILLARICPFGLSDKIIKKL